LVEWRRDDPALNHMLVLLESLSQELVADLPKNAQVRQ
jgi:hypothetical protein